MVGELWLPKSWLEDLAQLAWSAPFRKGESASGSRLLGRTPGWWRPTGTSGSLPRCIDPLEGLVILSLGDGDAPVPGAIESGCLHWSCFVGLGPSGVAGVQPPLRYHGGA